MIARTVFVLTLCAGWAAAQNVDQMRGEVTAFEVASLHRVDPSERLPGISKEGGPGTNKPDTFRCDYCTLAMFIEMAFDLKLYQIALPSGLEDEHYMLTARLPANSSKEDFANMMRRLLQERFEFTYRMVKRKHIGYTLTVAKGGPKFRAAIPLTATSDSTPEVAARPGQGFSFKTGKEGFPVFPDGPGFMLVSVKVGTRLSWKGAMIPEFAARLSDQVAAPVVDKTELSGRYDILLTWSPDPSAALTPAAASPWPPLTEALISQLGLKLNAKKVDVQTLLVTHIERVPRAN